MQMFDLVEEVNGTFYEYLGVDGNSSTSEIRRAYRKLSLLYHPDKNPSAEDAQKFQRLVAIYEILKDDESRQRYDDVLKFGLPDWRMPSFYFRKLRKMSFAESCILFAILATAIHYACLWGAYFEQKWNLEAFLFRRKRKRAEERKMNAELNRGYKPRWKDILPFVIVWFFYNLVVSTPKNVKATCEIVKQEITTAIDKKLEKSRRDRAKEEERKKIEENKKTKKEKKQFLSTENKEKRKIYEIGVQNAMSLPVETFSDLPSDYEDEEELGHVGGAGDELIGEPWSNNDVVALIRNLSDFPMGVVDRWSKISESVNRELSEVVRKVKAIQVNCAGERIAMSTMMQNALGSSAHEGRDTADALFDKSHSGHDNHSSESASEGEGGSCQISSAKKKKERKKMAKKVAVASVPITKTNECELQRHVEEEEDELVENVEESVTYQRKKPRKKTKYLEASEPVDTCPWTQIEQKQLEEALRTFPKGTTDRWDRIANKIPTKTKAECMERIKTQSCDPSAAPSH